MDVTMALIPISPTRRATRKPIWIGVLVTSGLSLLLASCTDRTPSGTPTTERVAGTNSIASGTPIANRVTPANLVPKGLVASDRITINRPSFPRHYQHIRIAMLAYSGNPMGSFEDELLKKSVDLVVPATYSFRHIHELVPNTPQLLYANTSNLYLELLTDWLTFADSRKVSRELAFFHAARPVPFRGDSPSSRPVNWFWKVCRANETLLTDVTSAAQGRHPKGLAFGGAGESLYLGYPERFREINLDLVSGAGEGWSAELEYATGADPVGRPLSWKPLGLVGDSTTKQKTSGQLTFDPPADWSATSLSNSPRLFFVRFRTTTRGNPPIARRILGRDYVGAGGKAAGVVPAFDVAADINGDGYLDDAEYTRRASGKDARFVYESRMPCGSYGQMRFAANPGHTEFRQWAADYHRRLLRQFPEVAGFFMDNTTGKPGLPGGQVCEPLAQYGRDYGLLLQELARAIEPCWILCNTGGGGEAADVVVRANPAYMEEFAIRPLSHNYGQFEELAWMVKRRAAFTTPSPYAVLDSHPQRGNLTDPRMQIATLAYYYLLADPESTFLMMNGGFEPASSWKRHWTPAIAFDVGRPLGPWSEFSSGKDPADPGRIYKAYQRQYEKALVLYKPVSHKPGDWKRLALLGDETATKHDLPGRYRPLRADGTLGEVVTSVSLRNGEGAIMVKVD